MGCASNLLEISSHHAPLGKEQSGYCDMDSAVQPLYCIHDAAGLAKSSHADFWISLHLPFQSQSTEMVVAHLLPLTDRLRERRNTQSFRFCPTMISCPMLLHSKVFIAR
jgi:hypothetical protein